MTILAIGNSGSHYLSLLLGSHSQAMHIGEAHYLGKRQSGPPKVCFICKDSTQCPVFHDIDDRDSSRAYEIIFSRADPIIRSLIDTSKSLRWARRFLLSTPYTMKYIHLIRDPRAFARRWAVTYTTQKQKLTTKWKAMRSFPHKGLSLLFSDMYDTYIYNWLARNLEISAFIRRHDLDATIVTYRDLARDTAGEVKRLVDFIGLEYEPGQIEYWNFEHHGTQKSDYEWVKQAKTQYFDLRWQTFLSESVISRITDHAGMRGYLTDNGLAFTHDGLTRVAARPGAR